MFCREPNQERTTRSRRERRPRQLIWITGPEEEEEEERERERERNRL